MFLEFIDAMNSRNTIHRNPLTTMAFNQRVTDKNPVALNAPTQFLPCQQPLGNTRLDHSAIRALYGALCRSALQRLNESSMLGASRTTKHCSNSASVLRWPGACCWLQRSGSAGRHTR
jgi:hypothetical protein